MMTADCVFVTKAWNLETRSVGPGMLEAKSWLQAVSFVMRSETSSRSRTVVELDYFSRDSW